MELYHPRLHAVTKTGKTSFFEIWLDKENPAVKLLKGQLGGKTQEDTYTFKTGKNLGKANETTPLDQALMYAESRLNELRDEGYKPELPVPGQRWNTDANHRNLVMLAEKSHKHLIFPAYVQRK